MLGQLRPDGERVCALDLGAVRVGVAVSDELGMYAHPRGTLPGRPRAALLESLGALVMAEGISHIVVGLPLDMTGEEGERARKTRGVAQAIADATRCEVELWDERLTTVQARAALRMADVRGPRASALVDEAAAVTILQSWLDWRAAR